MSELLIFGLHAVMAALERDHSVIEQLWVDRGRRDERIRSVIAAAKSAQISIEYVTRRELDELAGDARHQGVIARTAVATPQGEQDLWRLLDTLDSVPFLLVLDGVQDPHNLGACLRSADAAGVQAVIVPRDRAAALTPVVRKVACGAAETVPLIQVTNLARTLEALQKRGVWITGAAGEAERPVYDLDLRGPLALVLGGEGKGLRRLTREHCDQLGKIPMAGRVESLNVSVATGIFLFEAVRQRQMA